jgi:hypothetical protein
MRRLRQLVAIVAITCTAWAAVVDNPVVCPDEPAQQEHQNHQAPGSPHCCLTAPCRTPTLSPSPIALDQPLSTVLAAVRPPPAATLSSIDAPTPPTPPPTGFDLA